MQILPREDIPSKEKNRDYVRQHFLYADSVLSMSNPRIARMTNNYNSYNLRHSAQAVQIFTHSAGKQNKNVYTMYPWARPKIDLINNEFLLRPLDTTVYTVNAEAKSAKLENYEMLVGAVTAKKDINKLREHGIDPMEGMNIPDELNDDVLADMSFKDMNEDLMQIIIEQQTLALHMKLKLAKNFQDIEIVGECYGRIYVDENGDEQYMRIDPRNRVCEDIEDDPFFQKSPIMGHREFVPVHTVLKTFNLTKQQRDRIESERTNFDSLNTMATQRDYFRKVNGATCISVIYLEWYSVEPVYTKISGKTNNQMQWDNTTGTIPMEMPAAWFESNADKHKKASAKYQDKVKNGQPITSNDYDVEVAYKEVAYRDVRIGQDIFVYSDKATSIDANGVLVNDDKVSVVDLIAMPFTMKREDNKKEVFSLSYIGAKFNVVNGETVSLQEITEKFAKVLDNCMYQITKELAKYKGKSMWFNQDGLPKQGKKVMKVSEVIYNMVNDSFVAYSASGSGNAVGRDITPADIVKEVDIGFSSSFPDLISLKREMQQSLDDLTGINKSRMGETLATETATNAQSDKRASQTITEGMFFLMNIFVEMVFVRLCETTKLTWGLYKPEKGKVILGDKLFKFMQVTEQLAYQDYGIHLADGGKALSLIEQWNGDAQAALNAKTITFKDKAKFDLAPTMIEKLKVLEKAEAMLAKQQGDAAVQQQAADKANVDAQIASNEKIAMDIAAQKQDFDQKNIVLEADEQIRVNMATENNKAKNKLVVDTSNHEQKNINQQITNAEADKHGTLRDVASIEATAENAPPEKVAAQ